MKNILLIITLLSIAFLGCEAPVEINEFRDYTAPVIMHMFPSTSYLSNSITIPSNQPFFIQFDDRMDPAIIAYDSGSITLENISLIPPRKIDLRFELINQDSCLLASFDPNEINGSHIYQLTVGNNIKNYNRLFLKDENLVRLSFMFQGTVPNTPPTMTITSHTNNQRSGKIIRISGNCSGIEKIVALFETRPETLYTTNLSYGSTNWQMEIPIPEDFTENQINTLKFLGRSDTSSASASSQVQLCFDLVPPTYYLIYPTANCVLSNTITNHGIAPDDNGIKQVTFSIYTNLYTDSNVSGSYWEIPINTTNLENGNYTCTLMIEDNPGNRVSKSFSVTVDNTTN